MDIADIYDKFDQIGRLTFATIDEGYPQTRIADLFAHDHEGLYFRTMITKAFYKQLKKMDKDIQDAVIAVPAKDEEHAKVMKATDKFEEGVTIKTRGDRPPKYGVKYCRRCELACPVGK